MGANKKYATKPKIMVVDDDQELLKIFKHQLSKESLDATFFDSAFDALKFYRLSAQTFDLVITDLNMEPKHGEGLIFDIKLLRPEQKIAVLSAEPSQLNTPKEFDIHVFEKPTSILDIVKQMLLGVLPS